VLGLRANWRQFVLLVVVNAFVGGMVGLERTVLPLLGEREFGVGSNTILVSFVASFGLAKALTNLASGPLTQRFGRRRLLIAGWVAALPVAPLLLWAPAWGWVVGANLFLGVNQGLAWSMTVNMKVDLVGPSRRGLALGLNEAAGYIALAATAFATGLIAERWGLRPEPFYLGFVLAACGLSLSVLFVRDTTAFVAIEAASHPQPHAKPSLTQAFADVTWRSRHLFGIAQAGFTNNLNDALAWALFPLLFFASGIPLHRVALLVATYPLIWGLLQLGTGWASDRFGRKPFVVTGMALQAVAIALVAAVDAFEGWVVAVVLLGGGTALVYPVLLAAVGDAVHPEERSTALGVYRFWRDAGAIAGALLSGVLADLFGVHTAILTVAALTLASAVTASRTMSGTARTVADGSGYGSRPVRP